MNNLGMAIIVACTIVGLVGFWTALYGKGDDLENPIVNVSFWFGIVGCILGVITVKRYTWTLTNPFPSSLMTRIIVVGFFLSCFTAILLLCVAYKVESLHWKWYTLLGYLWACFMSYFGTLGRHSNKWCKSYRTVLISLVSLGIFVPLVREIDHETYPATVTASAVLITVTAVLGAYLAFCYLVPMEDVMQHDLSTFGLSSICFYISACSSSIVLLLAICVPEKFIWLAITIHCLLCILILAFAVICKFHHEDDTPEFELK